MTDDTTETPQNVRAELSDAVARIVREHTGRGPDRTRTIVDREAVVVLLFGALTRGESVLVEHGRKAEVVELRGTFQEVMREDLVAAIEGILKRRVITLLSASSPDPDVTGETFVLGGSLEDEGNGVDDAPGVLPG